MPLAALEANLHGHVAFVQRHTPGMTVLDDDDLLLVDSALPSDTFNKILRARLDPAHADRRIAGAIAHFRDAGRPFAWWVGPGSRPLDLERRLQAHGLEPAEVELGMWLDLSRLAPQAEPPEGLAVRRARTAAELADFAAVNAANWDPPDPAVPEFYRRAAPLLHDQDSPMRLFVGYVDGVPAAASELFAGGGAAGVHMVSTRPAFQRRGIGWHMTWTALDEGRRMGLGLGVLQASPEGEGVYRRIGFEACCTFTEYR